MLIYQLAYWQIYLLKKIFLILVMLKIFSNFVFYLKNKKIQKHSKTEKI
jgi:hypothetical protein